jgi:hypothetical protein
VRGLNPANTIKHLELSHIEGHHHKSQQMITLPRKNPAENKTKIRYRMQIDK